MTQGKQETVVTMTPKEARIKARKLWQSGKTTEALHTIEAIVRCMPEAELAKEISLAQSPLTSAETAAAFGTEVVNEGQTMLKEAAHDTPLMARDLFGFAGRLVGGTLGLVGRTAGTLAGQIKKGWDEAQK